LWHIKLWNRREHDRSRHNLGEGGIHAALAGVWKIRILLLANAIARELMDIYRLISEHRVVLLEKRHDYFGD